MDEKTKDKVRSVVGKTVDTALLPLQVAVSKPAQKAYIGTILFTLTSIFLLCLSTIAYCLFYYNYIPQVGIERVIHLQFGDGHPHGTTTLASALASQQAYEVTIILHLPRTPNNVRAGNFMIDLSMLAPTKEGALNAVPKAISASNSSSSVLARSRRPGTLTYNSDIVDTANTLVGLPWYVLGWKRQSELLEVIMFEGVEFARGSSNVPDTLHVVIEADEKMQFYDAEVRILARFGGLRWIIYHHWILSFFLFTATFWSSSMLSTVLVWFVLSVYWGKPQPTKEEEEEWEDFDEQGNGLVKAEAADSDVGFDPTSLEDLSDTSRSFPTMGRQMPLHFSGRKKAEGKVKMEEEDPIPLSSMMTHEADDEDEDEGRGGSEWRDSGIGTSREDEKREDIRRRR